MTTKSVLVRLRGENSDLNRALRGSANESKVLARNLDDADKSSRRLSDGLETSNDRTTMLIQSALALGPALVPIGAQAVPVVMGLATQLGFAAAAAGVTALAFQGVGDALKAVNQYQLQPTEAHLQAMQIAMDKLGPQGRDFVRFLQELRPQMQELQDISQAGILPGVEDSMTKMFDRLPQVERIIDTISRTVGDLASEGGGSIAGPKWDEFFSFVEHDARPILTDMARTAGNLALGVAHTVTAFGPLTREFSDGFLGMSRDFEKWAAGLEDSRGFEQFVSYIEHTGPQVVDTLGALADAVLAIVEAAAPVGQVALPVIEALANAIATIARTPIGPVLLGVAAGVSAVSRAIALYQAANGSAALSSLMGGGARAAAGEAAAAGAAAASAKATGPVDRVFNVSSMRDSVGAIREYEAAVAELRVAEAEAAIAHRRYIGTMKASTVADSMLPGRGVSPGMVAATDDLVVANEKAAAASKRVAEAEQAKGTAFRESAVGAARAGALMAGLAIASSDTAEKTGLANTASLAMMGTMVGPWGTAIGAGIGLTMDMAAANNDLEAAITGANMALQSMDVTQMQDQLAALNQQIDASKDKTSQDFGFNPLKNFTEYYGGIVAGTNELFTGTQDKAESTRDALASQARAALDAQTANDAYAGAVGRAGVAAGYTRSEVNGLVAAMQEQKNAAVTAFGAETAWRQALKDARAQAAKTGAGIRGNSDAALKNRSVIQGLAAAWNNQSDAVKNNNARFREARAAFIQTATAMGVPKKAAIELANRLLDIPKQRVIQINMQGDAAALDAIRRIRAEMAGIHDKTVRLTYYVNQVNATNKARGPVPNADGGTVPKTGLPYADRHLYVLADGEEVTTNRNGEADAARKALKLINRGLLTDKMLGLAAGGTAGRRFPQPTFARAAAGGGTVRHVIDVRVSGEMDLRRAAAQIREVARDVAQGEIEAADLMNAEIARAGR